MSNTEIDVSKPRVFFLPDRISLWGELLAAGILALVAFMLYAPSLSFQYTFDDDLYTARNQVTSRGNPFDADIYGKGSAYGFNGENAGIYRPVTLLSFALEKNPRRAFKPRVSHQVNLWLYALGLVLMYGVLRLLMPTRPWYMAFFIGLVFATHPVHTEVVASAKSRDELLAFFFLMGSVMLWLWGRGAKAQNRKVWTTGLAAILFFLACGSKESALTFMAVFPVLAWFQGSSKPLKILAEIWPFWLAGATYLLIRTLVLDPSTANVVSDPVINNGLAAAEGPVEWLATWLLMQLTYLRLLVFPNVLSYDYSFEQIPVIGLADWRPWLGLVLLLGLLGMGLYGTWKRRPAGLGALFYLITLSVVSHLYVPMSATMAERFLFLPSMGFLMMGILGLANVPFKLLPQAHPWIFLGLLAGILSFFTWKTVDHLPVWKDNSRLFSYGVKAAPNSFRTHFNLAEIERVAGEQTKDATKLEKAIREYRRSLAIYPPQTLAWYNLGVCLMGLQRFDEAKEAFERNLELAPDNAASANNLGVIHFNRQELPQARAYFEQAMQYAPDFADPVANLGAVYHNLGDAQMAEFYYKKALELQPGNPNTRQNYVRLLNSLGRQEEAQRWSSPPQN